MSLAARLNFEVSHVHLRVPLLHFIEKKLDEGFCTDLKSGTILP
jgi:hypothetical protein